MPGMYGPGEAWPGAGATDGWAVEEGGGPEKWDGRAAVRIVAELERLLVD